jgi:hypothetical protein
MREARKMKKIAIIITLMLITIGCLSGCNEQSGTFLDSSSGICYYDWEATKTDYIGTYYSSLNEYQHEAKLGYTFAIVTIKINNQASQEVDTNPWNWEMEINGVRYNHDTATYDDSIGHITADVGKGGYFQTKIVYEIPEGATSASLIYTGFSAPYMEIDESLIPDSSQDNDATQDEEDEDEEIFDASSHLSIIESNAYTGDYGYTYVFGFVKNIGTSNLRFVKLSCTLYDASDGFIASEESYIKANILEPGDTSSFEFMIEEDYYNSYDLEIIDGREVDCTDTIASGLYISNDYMEETSYGTIYIKGKIKNIGSESADLVSIIARLYDSSGKLIGIARTGANEDGEVLETIYSGQTEYFKIYVFDTEYVPGSNVASYDLEATHMTLFFC